jgi:hypothetical protein
MVNYSTSINKTNNHLSPKESLNSDGQLFYQYQQTKQSPLTSTPWTQLDAQWAQPASLSFHFVHFFRKLCTEPSIAASYQISINMAGWF